MPPNADIGISLSWHPASNGALPIMVAVVIPCLLVYLTGPDTLDLWQSVPGTCVELPIVSLLFVGLGLVLMVGTIRLFVTVGMGTLAPWKPTQHSS